MSEQLDNIKIEGHDPDVQAVPEEKIEGINLNDQAVPDEKKEALQNQEIVIQDQKAETNPEEKTVDNPESISNENEVVKEKVLEEKTNETKGKKKNKTGLIIGIVAGMIVAAAIVLILVPSIGIRCKIFGHKPTEYVIDTEPTCTKKGLKHNNCSVCNEVLNEEEIVVDKNNHTWVEKTKEVPNIITVHHDRVTHEEPIYTQDPIYGVRVYWVCQTCGERSLMGEGKSMTSSDYVTYDEDFTFTHVRKNPGHHVWYETEENVVIRYNQVFTGSYNTVIDREAYDEEIESGTKTVKYYICSSCGKEKQDENAK